MNNFLSAGGWRLRLGLSCMIGGLALLGAMGQKADAAVASAVTQKANAATKARVNDTYGKLPLSFEVNRGQTDGQVKFLSRGSGYSLFLTPKEAVLALRTSEEGQEKAKPGKSRTTKDKEADSKALNTVQTAVLRMQLVGANSMPKVVGEEELAGKSNYFAGKDPKKWRTNIPHYAKVRYEAVYPGIDLVYYGNQRQLEYDLAVAPGADPKAIRLQFRGADSLSLDEAGNLILHTAAGKVVQRAPRAYQEIDGTRRDVPARHVLADNDQVSFELGAYDTNRPLIIDPVLSYSTYLGGSRSDIITERGRGIAVDHEGNAYVIGETAAIDFPTVNALQPDLNGSLDAFVTKLNASGDTLVYSTYLGGSNSDRGTGIAVDQESNVYVTGSTSSGDFPTFNALQPNFGGFVDAFVAKLNASGDALTYSTYLGGSRADYASFSIAVDEERNVYVTGRTQSVDFPTFGALQPNLGGSYDAFVAKLNASGDALDYSTYLGGSSLDEGFGIAVDEEGNVHVTGDTLSVDFPTVNAFQPAFGGGFADAFVAKLSALGEALAYCNRSHPP